MGLKGVSELVDKGSGVGGGKLGDRGGHVGGAECVDKVLCLAWVRISIASIECEFVLRVFL